MKGYNCTIFAFGQTGSGKTYTLLGDGNLEGITQRNFRYLYELIKAESAQFDTSLFVTMVQIYFTKVSDLLTRSFEKEEEKRINIELDQH